MQTSWDCNLQKEEVLFPECDCLNAKEIDTTIKYDASKTLNTSSYEALYDILTPQENDLLPVNDEVDAIIEPITPTPQHQRSRQDESLYNRLLRFYCQSDDGRENKMLDLMIHYKQKISLRLLDWCVTNYAKQFRVEYALKSRNGRPGRTINMYNEYQLNRDSFSKRCFDPFCRTNRIQFPYKNGQVIETSLGQLNFFKWAIETEVLDFINKNHDVINRDMNARNSNSKRARPRSQPSTNAKTRKRREELSTSAGIGLAKSNTSTDVSFK